MSLLSVFGSVISWFKNKFVDHVQDADKVAVTVTEAIKAILANPVTNMLINIADAITCTQVPSNIAAEINAIVQKALAVELGVQQLPANPTEADIEAFETGILKAFNVTAD